LNTALINPALTHRFPSDAADVVSDAELCEALRNCVAPERSLLAVIAREHPDWQLSPWAHAVASSLDDCMLRILAATRLESEIEHELARILPFLAADCIETETRLDCDNPFLALSDLIVESAIGWNDSLGRSGDRLLKTIRSAVDKLTENIDDAGTELGQFLDGEAKRIVKLESRLVATENRQASRAAGPQHGRRTHQRGDGWRESAGRHQRVSEGTVVRLDPVGSAQQGHQERRLSARQEADRNDRLEHAADRHVSRRRG
tara:strand:- start:525 stop:1307 length:783 start_codon:yes stop_codon:yes gene_type:complete